MLQPSLPYNLLKFSLQMFRRTPGELTSHEQAAVQSRAEEECIMQKKILTSKEGMQVVVPQKSVQDAMAGIAKRYESPERFEQDMAANDLDLRSMATALEVDLTVEATLVRVATGVQPPSETQVEEAFAAANTVTPEQRRLRHILITINDQFPENSRQAALTRINKVHDKALAARVDFSELAQRYSECPSALQGGSIGPVARGGIYPSLEETLFAMEPGEISKVVESNMGFHILLCEEVIKTEKTEPGEAKSQIRKAIHSQLKKKAVQSWLATLQKKHK
ncbi:MAG: nitrogen fixation protein NifM [Proteobacteria bacterium]|nr:nitrogen fixation protein NifM [Pseudomonadota bacterium]MBU1420237.1 nitrogen fixation protein NifM [Pseudomonadota bacterium]MBU1455566.1 nitrogen fixation protein NifM [Pseudomonadota bacterium]